jgi:hypothetical protein
MRFNVGEVWTDGQRRAAVVGSDEEGRSGMLHFADTGEDRWFNWFELTQPGIWRIDLSPKPTRNAEELRTMTLERIAVHPVCPQGMDVQIRSVGGKKWVADAVPPPNQSIAYADCAMHIRNVSMVLSLLFDLA